jgi:iron complex transport system substrate-binding protein
MVRSFSKINRTHKGVKKESMKKTILAGLLAIGFSSLASATSYPLTLKDDLGRSVKLMAQPKRIVSMMPSHTETLFAVGAGTSLVGVDEYSNFPKLETEKLPKTGNGFTPNLEAIAALKPDLVLTDESSGSKLVQNLEKLGITVYAGVAQTYNDVFEKISVIGKITNHEKNALNLITKMRSELSAIQASVTKLPRVSVYFEVDPTPYAAGSSSFIGAMIDKAGGNNIIPVKLGAFPQISPELVIQSNPEVILGVDLADLLTRPAWDKIKAVQNKRVINFSGEINDAISRPGPRLPVALKALAKALHPEL